MTRSFFRTAFDSMIKARERQAQRLVNATLLGLDDETLKAHGYDRATLSKGRVPISAF